MNISRRKRKKERKSGKRGRDKATKSRTSEFHYVPRSTFTHKADELEKKVYLETIETV